MQRHGDISLIPAWLPLACPYDSFPPATLALREPNGLLAMGGDLHPQRLLYAYTNGIFPWYSDENPILWWSPDPRFVLYPKELRVSRSLRRTIKRNVFEITFNQDFRGVLEGCAATRRDGGGTWINAEMADAYCELHALGHAQSVECWCDGQLAGGLYGVAIGRVFFGESMFSRRNDASKVALSVLCDQAFELIDCQLPNDHLIGLGARGISRTTFLAEVRRLSV